MRKRSLAAAILGALALVGSLLVAAPAQALNDTGTGGVFVPATGRILDTQAGTGGYSTPMPAGTYRTIKVAGLFGLPDDGSVGAVSLNATVAASSGNGTLFGRPDANTGRTSMLIYSGVKGEFTSNTATIAVGADGTIQVMAETNARLILDVQGYYTANTDGTASGGFVPVAKRIVDTRSGLGTAKATIAPGKSIDVQITGSNGIPAGASGVVVNLIAINSSDSDGYLTPYATGDTKPQNALHYAPSISTSAQAQVPLSSGGKITIANGSATANLVVDLQGYFTAAGTNGAVFTPSYGRAYDSRASGSTALTNGETRSIQIAGKAGVPVMGSGITAVTLTLIVSHAGSAGYAEAWADGTSKPGTTAINFQADDIRTNTITVPLGANGKIALRNVADATNYVVDVQGWYSNPLAAKISCGGVAASGAWNAEKPETLSCAVTAAPADSSNRLVQVLTDEGIVEFQRSESASVTKNIALTPSAGLHTLTAVVGSPDGSDIVSEYEFGLGDWASSALVPFIRDNSATALTPFLRVLSQDDLIPVEADIVYEIFDAQGARVAISPVTNAGWKVPAGLLVSGETYSWRATITANSGGASQPTTVQTHSWSVRPDAAMEDDYQQLSADNDEVSTGSTTEINAEDRQHTSVSTSTDTPAPASQGGMSPMVSVEDGGKGRIRSDRLFGNKKTTVGKGYIRTAFSSVVTVNKYATQAAVEAESGLYVKTSANPKKMVLTDVWVAGGVSISVTISKSPSITISQGGKTVRKKTTADKSALKAKQVQRKTNDLKVDAQVITSFEERAESVVSYGSSTYSATAG
ncbi:hypothetical protein [uncultured Microbacterium sp.]|uniref:hypothetical protein n=1 Tax=uncultured Microbacterium sp. TaxID=191216 RepID=UPI0025E4499D|nr:hypothetical protein [uncultured Microbacterium sp.]